MVRAALRLDHIQVSALSCCIFSHCRLAMDNMRALPRDVVRNVQSKTLYTRAEEAVLASVGTRPPPGNDVFEELLLKHYDVFHEARTAYALNLHWQHMKYYGLLNEQRTGTYNVAQHDNSFAGELDLCVAHS